MLLFTNNSYTHVSQVQNSKFPTQIVGSCHASGLIDYHEEVAVSCSELVDYPGPARNWAARGDKDFKTWLGFRFGWRRSRRGLAAGLQSICVGGRWVSFTLASLGFCWT
ncbi:hypothetical protein CICLE_v10022974mg [Citrus x clementina]|uniref:Uncharacterized protein n=1 Tax=Citrus clementina TaxID=85681 RepID=V4T864_CITCL|nr:hypothetical protein CICLE_v10022974mg [Citrus x clementina]